MIEVLVVEVALEAGLLCVASILLPIFDILPGASCASAVFSVGGQRFILLVSQSVASIYVHH